jgi:biotin carboxyl carrier protein
VTVDLELDGTRRRVVLRRAGERWIAEIDGREVEVSVVDAGDRWSMLVGPAVRHDDQAGHDDQPRHDASYDVAFDERPGGELIVHVNGFAVPLTVVNGPGRPKHRGRTAGRDDESDAPRTIVAPMPGRIVKVLVKPDEAVAARQPLVVVEAMKMENELRAPRAGTVAEVRVAEGASVEANTVLVVLR